MVSEELESRDTIAEMMLLIGSGNLWSLIPVFRFAISDYIFLEKRAGSISFRIKINILEFSK